MEERQTLAPGTSVYSADGQMIGTIQSSSDSYFLVEQEVQIPLSTITMSREGEVHLSVSKADALEQRWTQNPATRVTAGQAVERSSDYTAIQEEDSLEEDPMPTPGEETAPEPPVRHAGAPESLERPSGETGPNQYKDA